VPTSSTDDMVTFDRRSLLLSAMAAAAVVGCSRKGDTKGAKTVHAATAAAKPKGPADPMWTSFRDLYLAPEGRIVDNGNGGISHSEGQSYGMLMAVLNNDRPAFEALLGWTEAHLARVDVALYSWRYDPRQANPVTDTNNATDGDTVIAWALAKAARQWDMPTWEKRSAQIRAAIRDRLVVERAGQHLLLPGLVGFDHGAAVTINPSYFVWPALDDFRRFDGPGRWEPVIATCEALIGAARFGDHKLPTDWIYVRNDGVILPAPDKPAQFGFDAIRVPLFAVAGHRAGLVAPITDYWRAKMQAGQPIPAWIDVQTGAEAPYPLSAGGMDVVKRLLGEPLLAHEALAADYYGCVLQLLARFLR